jgi:hypothetical protein
MELEIKTTKGTHDKPVQIVSSCLTIQHGECSGFYSDRDGNLLVRCACKCHEIGERAKLMIIEEQSREPARKTISQTRAMSHNTDADTTTQQHQRLSMELLDRDV